jgi:hypothetical protein
MPKLGYLSPTHEQIMETLDPCWRWRYGVRILAGCRSRRELDLSGGSKAGPAFGRTFLKGQRLQNYG